MRAALLSICVSMAAADIVELKSKAEYDSIFSGDDNVRQLKDEGASVILFVNDAEANYEELVATYTERAALLERTFHLVSKDALSKASAWGTDCYAEKEKWVRWCATVHTLGEDGQTALLARSTHARLAQGDKPPQDESFLNKFIIKAVGHKTMGDLLKTIPHDEL